MTPSIRFRIGRPPFAISLNVPITDVIGMVAGLFCQPEGQEPSPTVTASARGHYVLVHANGEVDIDNITQQEALEVMAKALKQVKLDNPRLYCVQGDVRTLVEETSANAR